MFVRVGWSGETKSGQWRKIDVGCDEIDLVRALREHFSELYRAACRLGGDDRFQILQNAITPAWSYEFLEIEAERYVLNSLVKSFGSDDAAIPVRVRALNSRRKAMLDELETRVFGPSEPATA